MTDLQYRRDLKSVARRLRSELTPAERTLWMHLRRKQIRGVQFLRQKPLGDYVVDFCALKSRLVVEVDGGQHFDDGAERRDMARDRYLVEQGFRVLRFTNTQVLKETTDVLEVIHAALAPAKSPPAPLFQRGEKRDQA